MAALILRSVRELLKRVDFATVPRRHRHKKKWSCGKGFSPFLTLEVPLAPRKGCSDHPAHTAHLSLNVGKSCNDAPQPQGSPHFSRDPFSCFSDNPGISSTAAPPPPPLPPQPPLHPGRCSFQPCSPLLGRLYCREPNLSGSSPPSPCLDRFSHLGSPPPRQHQRSPYCTWISPPRTPRLCPRNPYNDQTNYVWYCTGYPSALETSLVTSPALTHLPPGTSSVTSPHLTRVPLETGPMISPPLTHRPLGTGIMISPPLAHRPMETSPVTLSHRVVETGQMITPVLSQWSSRRSYNDPPLTLASSPPAGSFYLKPPESCELKPQFDLPVGKNDCSSSPSSQPGLSGSSVSTQETSYHYAHLSSEANILVPESPYYAICLAPGSVGPPCSPQSQAPRKPCFESLLSCETGRNSYFVLSPGTNISGPPCLQEPPVPCCPHPTLSFPSSPGNQCIPPPQSPPRRSYNEPPLPTPVPPKMKSPKYLELRQSCPPHKCHSLVNTLQHTPPGQRKLPKASTSPSSPSCPSGLSGPPCMEPSTTTPLNSCPTELPSGIGTVLPTVVPRTLRLPCDPALPSSYAQGRPRGPLMGPLCNTHVYSVVPSTPHSCALSGSLNHSTGPPQCHNQPMMLPCGTYSTPRGPPHPNCQPVVPPCSTHIYSFIPLRTPFDPQSLPIVPRVRTFPDAIPCGLHVYPVASRGPPKEPPRIPYSCPAPSSKSSSCSTNPSCSSTLIISECQSTDSQSQSSPQSKSGSQSKSPRNSRSQSNSSHQNISQGQVVSLQLSRRRNQSKSPRDGKNRGQSRSPRRDRGQSKSPHSDRSQDQSNNPHRSKSHGRSKSPHRNKKSRPEQKP